MFTPTSSSGSNNDDGKAIVPTSTYMNECLKAIQTVVRNKIRTVTIYKAGKRDGIGIILYVFVLWLHLWFHLWFASLSHTHHFMF